MNIENLAISKPLVYWINYGNIEIRRFSLTFCIYTLWNTCTMVIIWLEYCSGALRSQLTIHSSQARKSPPSTWRLPIEIYFFSYSLHSITWIILIWWLICIFAQKKYIGREPWMLNPVLLVNRIWFVLQSIFINHCNLLNWKKLDSIRSFGCIFQ